MGKSAMKKIKNNFFFRNFFFQGPPERRPSQTKKGKFSKNRPFFQKNGKIFQKMVKIGQNSTFSVEKMHLSYKHVTNSGNEKSIGEGFSKKL